MLWSKVLEQSIAFHHSERQHMTKMPPQASRKGSPFVFFPHVRRGVTAAAAGGRVIEFTERHLGTEQLPELYRDRCTDVYRASAASEAVRRSEKHAILCDPGVLIFDMFALWDCRCPCCIELATFACCSSRAQLCSGSAASCSGTTTGRGLLTL